MNKKQLAHQLGISPSMVSRLVRRGMPLDLKRAEQWRRRHLEPGRVKGVRADTMDQPKNTVADVCTSATPSQAPPVGGPVEAAGAADERAADNPGYQASRSRQAAADASIAEIRLAELEGSLVRIDLVEAALAARLAPVREGLLQIPARLAPLLAAQSDPARVQTQLEVEIHHVLAPLARPIMEQSPKTGPA